jgi:tRNA(Ile)-lysidine synthase TilS/MesJ
MQGVKIDPETRTCQYCRTISPLGEKPSDSDCILMDTLLQEKNQNSRYDAIFALSGGKDSVFTLYQLKSRYPDLRVLSILFDNGFISQTAIKNAKKICSRVSCDLDILSMPDDVLQDGIKKAAQTKEIFPMSAISRASDICNLCMSTIKQKIIERALQENTSVIVFGFTPGQTKTPIVQLSLSMIKWNRELYSSILTRMGIEDTKDQFLINEKYIREKDENLRLYIIHPLCVWGYNKERIISTCEEIGWVAPDIEDPNSTNCLLNAFAIKNHIEKYGLHPYAFDLATLVRTGCMNRDEALRTINSELPENLIEFVKKKIKIIE